MSQKISGIKDAYTYYVIVELEQDKPSDTIVIAPEYAQKNFLGAAVGRVVSIGPSAFRDHILGGEPPFSVGERVSFKRYEGTAITLDCGPNKGKIYRMLRDIDICVGIEEYEGEE